MFSREHLGPPPSRSRSEAPSLPHLLRAGSQARPPQRYPVSGPGAQGARRAGQTAAGEFSPRGGGGGGGVRSAPGSGRCPCAPGNDLPAAGQRPAGRAAPLRMRRGGVGARRRQARPGGAPHGPRRAALAATPARRVLPGSLPLAGSGGWARSSPALPTRWGRGLCADGDPGVGESSEALREGGGGAGCVAPGPAGPARERGEQPRFCPECGGELAGRRGWDPGEGRGPSPARGREPESGRKHPARGSERTARGDHTSPSPGRSGPGRPQTRGAGVERRCEFAPLPSIFCLMSPGPVVEREARHPGHKFAIMAPPAASLF